jgi:RecG-like helicase
LGLAQPIRYSSQARQKITEVKEEMQNQRSCFRVVKGDHGEGKIAMLHHIQTQIAKNKSACYSYIFYDKS